MYGIFICAIMNSAFKCFVKKILSKRVINVLRNNLHVLELKKTEEIFQHAAMTPDFLGYTALREMARNYPPRPEYGYDSLSLEKRGRTRAAEILRLPGAQNSCSFLELGCWDGMTSSELHKKNKSTTAIDHTDEGFDSRAVEEGVSFFKMDSASLQFQNETFDFIFSYNAFEHFKEPEEVLRESIRVLKKGGSLFLSFGPLYFSAFGAHAYRSIPIPYCTILFPPELINRYTSEKNLEQLDFDYNNGWSYEQYSDLWDRYSYTLKKVHYVEYLDLEHLNLIRTFPTCFKSKGVTFKSFLVSEIQILFRKKV